MQLPELDCCSCAAAAAGVLQSKLVAVSDNTIPFVVCESDYPVVPGWYNPVGDQNMVGAWVHTTLHSSHGACHSGGASGVPNRRDSPCGLTVPPPHLRRIWLCPAVLPELARDFAQDCNTVNLSCTPGFPPFALLPVVCPILHGSTLPFPSTNVQLIHTPPRTLPGHVHHVRREPQRP